MKISPPSGDMLIKVAIGLVALGGAAMLIYTIKSKASAAAGAAAQLAEDAANAVNPTSADNLAYTTYNEFGSAVMPDNGPGRNADGSWSLGGFLYDITHPFTAYQVAQVSKPNGTGFTQ